MARYVAVEQDGKVQVHMEGLSNYATLCGMDGDDPSVGQRPAEVDIGRRIDCPHCRDIFNQCKAYRRRDFA